MPHIYGLTRSDTIFGAGYAGAEDRLFFMDVLRHAGRAQLSGFAGGANKAMDADVWANAPYNEADLQEQVDKADDLYGAQGAALQQDVVDYVAGINQYISEARTDVTKMPYEYAAIAKPLEDWKPTDVIATAALIGGIFGKGGGNELGSAQVLEEAKDRYGGAAGEQAWRDFRRQDDPEAPTTVKSGNGNFDYPRTRGTTGIALPDEGSLVDPPNNGSSLLAGGIGGLLGGFGNLGAMSNALLVSGAESESGHPVAVIGPQVAYFMPQILLEQDLHGPDIDAQGASFVGVSPYVLLGRGQDFAWSATSAGQDIIDTFAEKLCEPDGSPPNVQSTHYLYKGQCRAMETLTRVNNITPNPGDPSPPETYTLQAQRTVHGIVAKRGRVDGQPVAFARQRSTYFHEADSARAFADLNRPSKVQNVQDFQRVVSDINFTFNWFYADDRDIGYFNSGDNPERARRRRSRFTQLGHGRVRLEGLGDDLQDLRRHAVRGASPGHQPGLHHLLEQQAGARLRRGRRPVRLRADLPLGLARRADRPAPRGRRQDEPAGADRLDGGGRHHGPARQAAAAAAAPGGRHSQRSAAAERSEHPAGMARGRRAPDRPQPERPVRQRRRGPDHGRMVAPPARGRVQARDGNGVLRRRARRARLRQRAQQPRRPPRQRLPGRLVGLRVEGPAARARAVGRRSFLAHLLRQRLADRLPQRAAPGALGRPGRARPPTLYDEDHSTAGVQRVDTCPAGKSDQWCFDSVRFRPIGAVTVPTIHWINRPTYQQAVEMQGHRPRGYIRPKGATPLRVSLVPAFKGCARRPTASMGRRSPSDRAARPSCAPTT